MAEHTPGPWEATGGTYIKVDGRIGIRIIGIGQYPEVTDEEVEANARLIAAAPDLLEVAEAILENPDADFELHPDIWAMLDSAVAKARGDKA